MNGCQTEGFSACAKFIQVQRAKFIVDNAEQYYEREEKIKRYENVYS